MLLLLLYEIEENFVLKYPLKASIKNNVQSLFEDVVSRCLKSFFQLGHQH